jgi:hypothetical protein
MKLITIIFILNASLLLLHEIESAYEKEWEILKLPGKITGFLLLHIPLILLLFYGAFEIQRISLNGLIIGILTGVGGIIPFLVHRVVLYRKDKFNLPVSKVIIYMNIAAGIATLVLSVAAF